MAGSSTLAPARVASAAPLDWKRAHFELVELSRKNAELDAEIGRWLLYAARAATPAWLGYSSVREYAEHLFGFTPRQTQERLRVAESLEELAMLRTALELGELNWSVVRELTRVATRETEAEWLKAAQHRTARQVEQMVRGHRPGDHPGDPPDARLVPKVLRFELAPEVYATVQEALAKIRRDAGERIDDEQALLLMARQVLGGPKDEGRSSYQLAVSMCPSCRRGFQHARGQLVELSREALETACCDAQHIGDVGSYEGSQEVGEGVAAEAPVDHLTHVGGSETHVGASETHVGASETHVGASERAGAEPSLAMQAATTAKRVTNKASQSIPPKVRRQVMRRAGGCCEVPGCSNDLYIDAHHCDLRSEGGTHDPQRILALCGAHQGAPCTLAD